MIDQIAALEMRSASNPSRAGREIEHDRCVGDLGERVVVSSKTATREALLIETCDLVIILQMLLCIHFRFIDRDYDRNTSSEMWGKIGGVTGVARSGAAGQAYSMYLFLFLVQRS